MESVLRFTANVLMVLAVVACVGSFLVSLGDFASRDDLSPAERAGWGLSLILFWPVAGIVYLRCGPGEQCLPAALERWTAWSSHGSQ